MNDDLNKQYFETKEKYKELRKNRRKRTIKEKILFFVIAILIGYFFIYKNNTREEKIEKYNSLEYKTVTKDSILKKEEFSILIPNNFQYYLNFENFSLVARKKNNLNYIFHVLIEDMQENDLFKSYEKTMKKARNKYYYSNFKKINSNEVILDILINNENNKGKVKLIKLKDNKFFIVHVSSPSYIWDEVLSMKIINSFKPS